ncbi:single-stranded DNA-binding protein [Cryobacterium sp. BB736]|uniref:single-stranded DNA-binding protein n=1 Tax=Cryobacterium sp. BB736 TaxID=2746963 RepID=UPI00187636EE|nr:single-stranded DNA-binding protein [Cryobacterium sp. BB736]
MSKATITLEGFVANDIEIRNAGTHRVVELSVPHTPSKKNDAGQWEDTGPTTWFSATFWDEHADAVMDTVQKGSLVHVSGSVELEVYAKRDGTPGGKVKVMFPTVAVVVRRPKRGTTQPAESWAPSEPAADVWSTPGSFNDETPF